MWNEFKEFAVEALPSNEHKGSVRVEVVKEDEDLRSYNVQFGKIQRALGFEPE